MGHRNEFACSESNSVQSSRSKLTTCLRTQILISTATSDNCLQKLGNNLWHYFKLIFKFLSNLLLKIIINCVNTQTSMTRFWRSIIWNSNLAWSWPKNTRPQKSVPSISLVLQKLFFKNGPHSVCYLDPLPLSSCHICQLGMLIETCLLDDAQNLDCQGNNGLQIWWSWYISAITYSIPLYIDKITYQWLPS